MKGSSKDYQTLLDHSKKIRLLESISHLLEWDQETYMPKAAFGFRAEQLELMASLAHKEKTHPQFSKTLGKLIDLKTGKIKSLGLKPRQKAALREWRSDFIKAKALPAKFVAEFAKHTSESISIWAKAKKENDFDLFAPFLEKTIQMCRAQADYLGYKKHPYDALLDLHEPDMTTQEIDNLFKKIKKGVIPLLEKISKRPEIKDDFLHGKFSQEKILHFSHVLLEAMGYDFQKGRLDLSNHPFSMALHPSDSRITTRIHNHSLFDPLTAAFHEGGHSLYEMGMDPKDYGSPLCEAVSLGIHESQSRIWETRIGQSKAFWKHFLPGLKTYFPELKSVTLEAFYKGINKVKASFIRVEADEVTYSLHVIIRFELEKELIAGNLKVSELPEAWNFLMNSYLKVTPTTYAEGCLQDIHWSMGSFGYFPTYTLGNLYAAEFYNQATKDFRDFEDRISKGNLLFFREWLKENIHQYGREYRAKELLKKITGKTLSETPYLDYLNKKYKEIYKL